jgi:hypothetical protein
MTPLKVTFDHVEVIQIQGAGREEESPQRRICRVDSFEQKYRAVPQMKKTLATAPVLRGRRSNKSHRKKQENEQTKAAEASRPPLLSPVRRIKEFDPAILMLGTDIVMTDIFLSDNQPTSYRSDKDAS